MQNRKTNFGCGKMHFAKLAAWQTNELELELRDSKPRFRAVTHISRDCTAFVLQAAMLQSQQLGNCVAAFFFASSILNFIGKEIAGKLPSSVASLVPLLIPFLASDNVIACRTKPACI